MTPRRCRTPNLFPGQEPKGLNALDVGGRRCVEKPIRRRVEQQRGNEADPAVRNFQAPGTLLKPVDDILCDLVPPQFKLHPKVINVRPGVEAPVFFEVPAPLVQGHFGNQLKKL